MQQITNPTTETLLLRSKQQWQTSWRSNKCAVHFYCDDQFTRSSNCNVNYIEVVTTADRGLHKCSKDGTVVRHDHGRRVLAARILDSCHLTDKIDIEGGNLPSGAHLLNSKIFDLRADQKVQAEVGRVLVDASDLDLSWLGDGYNNRALNKKQVTSRVENFEVNGCLSLPCERNLPVSSTQGSEF
jgi:hypothetical protein